MLMLPGTFLSRILLTRINPACAGAGALGITPNVSFFKLISITLVLGCSSFGCSGQSQQALAMTPTLYLESPTSVILKSNDINTSNLLKVDDGLEISDRSDCLPKDCAVSVWKILQQESLAPSSTSSLQLGISLRSFQTTEDANSNREKLSNIGGQPGYRMLEVPVNILPEQSWAYAHAGWFVVVTTTYGNMEIALSLSHSSGGMGIDESERVVILLENLAKLQIDKLLLAENK